MSGEIQIYIDEKDVQEKLKVLRDIEKGAPKAMMRALNRTVTGMKTDAGREVTARYLIKQRDVKEKLETGKASMSDLSVSLRSRGRPIRSIRFRHKANTKPGRRGGKAAFLRVSKAESGAYLEGGDTEGKAFIAVMHNGAQGIFRRTGKHAGLTTVIRAAVNKNTSRYIKRTFRGKGREIIKQVHSPGVVQMLSNTEVSQGVTEKAAERFEKQLDHQIKHLLNSRKG